MRLQAKRGALAEITARLPLALGDEALAKLERLAKSLRAQIEEIAFEEQMENAMGL